MFNWCFKALWWDGHWDGLVQVYYLLVPLPFTLHYVTLCTDLCGGYMFLYIVILMLMDIAQSSVRFSHFVNLWLIPMIAIVLRLFIWLKFLIYEPICIFNKVDDDKSTYLRIKTQIATNEYASSVPMDMRSTRAARSNRNAISAARRKPDFRKTHSVDANVYSHFKTHRNCCVFSCRLQEALSILNWHPDRHAETRQRRAGSLIKSPADSLWWENDTQLNPTNRYVTCNDSRNYGSQDGGLCASIYPGQNPEQQSVLGHGVNNPRHGEHGAQ